MAAGGQEDITTESATGKRHRGKANNKTVPKGTESGLAKEGNEGR